jgi:hypothetical protein
MVGTNFLLAAFLKRAMRSVIRGELCFKGPTCKGKPRAFTLTQGGTDYSLDEVWRADPQAALPLVAYLRELAPRLRKFSVWSDAPLARVFEDEVHRQLTAEISV